MLNIFKNLLIKKKEDDAPKLPTSNLNNPTEGVKLLNNSTSGKKKFNASEVNFKEIDKPQFLRDDFGRINGVITPEGVFENLTPSKAIKIAKEFLGESQAIPGTEIYRGTREEQLIEEFNQKNKDKALIDSLNPSIPNATPEQLLKVGKLSADQQNITEDELNLPGKVDIGRALIDAGRAGILAGGAAGATAAAGALGLTAVTGGAAAPSIPLAAAIAGGGTFLYVGGRQLFKAYDEKDRFNTDFVKLKKSTAINNMQDAIFLANQGLGDEANDLAIIKFYEGIQQLRIAEELFKKLSKDPNKYSNEVYLELVQIENFKKLIPELEIRLTSALKKPTKNYLQNSVVESNGLT